MLHPRGRQGPRGQVSGDRRGSHTVSQFDPTDILATPRNISIKPVLCKPTSDIWQKWPRVSRETSLGELGSTEVLRGMVLDHESHMCGN